MDDKQKQFVCAGPETWRNDTYVGIGVGTYLNPPDHKNMINNYNDADTTELAALQYVE